MHPLAVVPRPRRLERRPGELRLPDRTTISYPDRAVAPARLCSEVARRLAGALLERVERGATLQLELGDPLVGATSLGRSGRLQQLEAANHALMSAGAGIADPGSPATALESYRISIDEERALLVSPSPAGLCNAVQTLRQLLPVEAYLPALPRGVALSLPCAEIEDAPSFAWRGGQLDVARHIMPADFLFRFVDLLAMHKLNVLHLHLTDDQGWRVPSAHWPRLVDVAAWRGETLVGHAADQRGVPGRGRFDGTPHGGFYPLATLSALVGYASERNVTVVPEIDLPGHVQSAVAAYPELGSASGPLEVMKVWGISKHVLNCSPTAMRFCEEVLDELLEIFPTRYVHLGGDECPRTEWRDDPRVRARIAELGLPGAEALQGWFTHQLARFLAGRGRRLVGWDEIVEGGPLPAGATVMSWRGEQGGVEAATAGFDVVMSPQRPCYFDHYQSASPDEPLAIGGLNTLEDVYRYRPVPDSLAPEAACHVLGTQFQLWSEYLPDAQAVEYMAFPRAVALAEVAWSGPGNEFDEFRERLVSHLLRLDALGVNYRPLDGPSPWQRGGGGVRRRFDPPR